MKKIFADADASLKGLFDSANKKEAEAKQCLTKIVDAVKHDLTVWKLECNVKVCALLFAFCDYFYYSLEFIMEYMFFFFQIGLMLAAFETWLSLKISAMDMAAVAEVAQQAVEQAEAKKQRGVNRGIKIHRQYHTYICTYTRKHA